MSFLPKVLVHFVCLTLHWLVHSLSYANSDPVLHSCNPYARATLLCYACGLVLRHARCSRPVLKVSRIVSSMTCCRRIFDGVNAKETSKVCCVCSPPWYMSDRFLSSGIDEATLCSGLYIVDWIIVKIWCIFFADAGCCRCMSIIFFQLGIWFTSDRI